MCHGSPGVNYLNDSVAPLSQGLATMRQDVCVSGHKGMTNMCARIETPNPLLLLFAVHQLIESLKLRNLSTTQVARL